MIKLVVLDLDGTLLGSDKQISSQNVEIIKKHHEKGVNFVICTGRTLSEVYHIDSIKNLLPYTDYTILTNGSACIDKTGNTIFDIRINSEDVKNIHSKLDHMSMMFELYSNGKVICSEKSLKEYKDYINPDFYKLVEDTRMTVPDILKFSEDEQGGINMILASFLSNSDMKKAYETVSAMDYYITQVGEKSIEIHHSSVDKGNGISNLAEKLGINKENILSIGDSHNDLTMRKAVGTLVSMGNGIDELKDISDFITSTNDDFGVYHALNKLL